MYHVCLAHIVAALMYGVLDTQASTATTGEIAGVFFGDNLTEFLRAEIPNPGLARRNDLEAAGRSASLVRFGEHVAQGHMRLSDKLSLMAATPVAERRVEKLSTLQAYLTIATSAYLRPQARLDLLTDIAVLATQLTSYTSPAFCCDDAEQWEHIRLDTAEYINAFQSVYPPSGDSLGPWAEGVINRLRLESSHDVEASESMSVPEAMVLVEEAVARTLEESPLGAAHWPWWEMECEGGCISTAEILYRLESRTVRRASLMAKLLRSVFHASQVNLGDSRLNALSERALEFNSVWSELAAQAQAALVQYASREHKTALDAPLPLPEELPHSEPLKERNLFKEMDVILVEHEDRQYYILLDKAASSSDDPVIRFDLIAFQQPVDLPRVVLVDQRLRQCCSEVELRDVLDLIVCFRAFISFESETLKELKKKEPERFMLLVQLLHDASSWTLDIPSFARSTLWAEDRLAVIDVREPFLTPIGGKILQLALGSVVLL